MTSSNPLPKYSPEDSASDVRQDIGIESNYPSLEQTTWLETEESGTYAWDVSVYATVRLSISDDETLTFTNLPSDGFVGSRLLMLAKANSGDGLTWPSEIANRADFDVSADAVGTYAYGIAIFDDESYIIGKKQVV